MIEWLKEPENKLVRPFVSNYWFLNTENSESENIFPKLNPDPCAHLLIAPKDQSFQYSNNSQSYIGKGSHWLYPYRKTYSLDHSNKPICIGIKFHIGALYSLPEINFEQHGIGSVGGFSESEVNSLLSFNESELLLLAKTSAPLCVRQLDSLLMPWISKAKNDLHSNLVKQVLPLLDNNLPINKIGSTLKLSQRTIERSFLKVTGLTLKQCKSMNQLEAILSHVYQVDAKSINWADIAHQFGFSDQPHFIRYLKTTLGLTPHNYAKQGGFTIDIYGGVEVPED